MGNKRKTLKQKIAADKRHKFLSLAEETLPSSPNTTPIENKNVLLLTTKYPYLIRDMLKTGITTVSVIAVQIVFFILLKKHIIKFPGVSY